MFREGQLTGTHGGGCLGKELQGQKDSIQSSPATAHFIVTSASQTPPRFQLTSFQTLASPELPATLQPSLSTRGFGYFATLLPPSVCHVFWAPRHHWTVTGLGFPGPAAGPPFSSFPHFSAPVASPNHAESQAHDYFLTTFISSSYPISEDRGYSHEHPSLSCLHFIMFL